MAKSALSKEESAYIADIKNFFNSDAWLQYAYPMMVESAQKEFPKPGTEDWQEKYMYAHALASVLGMVQNTLSNLAGKEEFMTKIDRFMETGDIDEA